MTRRRIIIQEKDIHQGHLKLSPDQCHYLIDVLRSCSGDTIEAVTSDTQKIYQAVLTIDKNKGPSAIITGCQSKAEQTMQLTLIQGLPKGPKMDLIIQKGTEIGIHRFIPFTSRRSIPKISEKAIPKLNRWKKIAQEASRQCRRPDVPIITPPASIHQLEPIFQQNELNLILWESEADQSIKTILRDHPAASLSVTIGPEGGLTHQEIEILIKYGGIPVTIGSNILRTETAAIAVAAMIHYEYIL